MDLVVESQGQSCLRRYGSFLGDCGRHSGRRGLDLTIVVNGRIKLVIANEAYMVSNHKLRTDSGNTIRKVNAISRNYSAIHQYFQHKSVLSITVKLQ